MLAIIFTTNSKESHWQIQGADARDAPPHALRSIFFIFMQFWGIC